MPYERISAQSYIKPFSILQKKYSEIYYSSIIKLSYNDGLVFTRYFILKHLRIHENHMQIGYNNLLIIINNM